MRILHLSDHYPPMLGGIETHVAGLASRQAARGDEVTVLTSSPAVADGRHSRGSGAVAVRRVRTRHELAPFDFDAYDVVHAHLSVMAPFTSPTAAAAARRGAPTVVTVHSMWNRMGPLPAAAAAVAGLRQSPVVWTAVSATAARHLADRLPGEQHVMVVPNAVDVRPRTASPTPGRDRPVRLVSTMRIARRKRPLQLLRIFDAVRRSASTPVQLTIVGDGPLRPRATRRLRRDGLEDAVTITGRVEPIEVLRHLHDADVYVAPALLESFGLAALEARCVGLPVVGHAGSGIGEFVQNGVEGWLCARDGDFVDRLLRLVDSADLRHEMSEHNRTTASTMTWPNALDRNDAAYDLALGAADRRLAATTRRR